MKKNLSIASIGDFCVDIYPQKKQAFLGGTAFNFAIHAGQAGANVSVFSAVGSDKYKDVFLENLQKNKINTSNLRMKEGNTSSVEITLDENNSPDYGQWKLGVLKNYVLDSTDISFLREQQAVRITFLKPLDKLFNTLYEAVLPNTLKVADFAGDSQYSPDIKAIENYIDALDIVIKSVHYSDTKSLTYLRSLAKKTGKLLLVLLGEKGSRVFFKDQTFYQPVINTQVMDANGAGDAYTAHFIVEYLKTKDIQQAMYKGTHQSSRVISQLGAVNL